MSTNSNDWQRGYFADAGYTFGFYQEMAPTRLAWAALMQGALAPTRGFRYVDLGCGQGFGLIVMAACHPDSEFVGIDYMPEHIAHARRLAELAGIRNVRFYEADFMDLVRPDASPVQDSRGQPLNGEVDYVVAHGIAAWIQPEVRESLWQLGARLLRPGGLYYMSYNVMAGWLAVQPMQKLMLLRHERGMGSHAAIENVRQTFELLEQSGSVMFKKYPAVKQRLEHMQNVDKAYLVQEYLNRCWQPQYVSDMMASARSQKLDYLGSATLTEIFEGLYPPAIRDMLRAEADPVIRESLRDISTCQGFRRDLYIKGKPTLPTLERMRHIEAFRVIANPIRSLPEVDSERPDQLSIDVAYGTFRFSRKTAQDILDALGDQAMDLGTLARHLPKSTPGELVQFVSAMIQCSWLCPYNETADGDAGAKRLNRVIVRNASEGGPYRMLAMPRHDLAVGTPDDSFLMLQAAVQATGENIKDVADAEVVRQFRTISGPMQYEIKIDGEALREGPRFDEIMKQRVATFMRRQWPMVRRAGMF